MVQFTFDGLFRTTNKGLPDTTTVDPYAYLSIKHFVYSLIVEILIGLLLTGLTGLSVYRSFYKIKNPKFFLANQTSNEQQSEKQSLKSKSENQAEENTNDNLIYRFDQEDHEKQKNNEKQDEEVSQNQENELEKDTVSQETTEWFLELDHKMTFFQPFLISFVVAVNVFASNVFVTILLAAAMVLYLLFNVKLLCSKIAILQLAFVVPCVAAFLPVFFQDLNMST